MHRWVARLEATNVELRRTSATITTNPGRNTSVSLAVMLTDAAVFASTEHGDVYVAIANAFRDVHRQIVTRRTHRATATAMVRAA